VKFQTYQTEQYVSTVQSERRERVKKFQLDYTVFEELARVANENNVTFFSTPLDQDSVDFLNKIVPLFKISSGDLTDIPLIRHIAQRNKPIIMSTGLGMYEEIRCAVDVIVEIRPDIIEKGELLLMHCVAAYPVPEDEVNLRTITWLRETFHCPVGHSDHSLGIKDCELAVAQGARVIEKHFTYRKENQTFHDHAVSADPNDMKELVQIIRATELMLGETVKMRSRSEDKNLLHMRRSVGAAVDIAAHTPIKEEWMTYLRPAWGLAPDQSASLIGKSLKRDIPAGDLIREDDIE